MVGPGPHQLQDGVLVSLPVNPRTVAQIDQKAHHDGLLLGVAEELDALRLAFVEDSKIAGFEIRDELAARSAVENSGNDRIRRSIFYFPVRRSL